MRTLLRISDPLSWTEGALFSADWLIYLAVYFPLLVFVQHQCCKAKITEKVWKRAGMQAFCLLYLTSSYIPKDYFLPNSYVKSSTFLCLLSSFPLLI